MFVAGGAYDVQRWLDLSEAPASLQAAPRGTIVLARDLGAVDASTRDAAARRHCGLLRIRGKSTIDVSARAAGKPAGAVMLLARRIMCDAGGSLQIVAKGPGAQGNQAGGAGGDLSVAPVAAGGGRPRASLTGPRAGPGSR
jgi:hypothetical protein